MGNKKQQWMLPMLALMFVLLFAGYYFYVRPVQADVQSLNEQVIQAQEGLQNAKNQGKARQDKPLSKSLQRLAELIPVTPYTDQLIKDLGRLQSVSHIEITNASFSDENTVNSKQLGQKFIPALDPNKVTIPQDKKNRITELQNTVNGMPPASIHTIEITLSVKGRYDDIYSFLYEVENLSRYLRLDSLSFGGAGTGNTGGSGNYDASGAVDGQSSPNSIDSRDLAASIKLTTYFVPQFASLLDKQPAVQVEPPSGKWDPTQYPVLKKPEKFSGQQ
jgi:Tfp pilus assembly protein PilO